MHRATWRSICIGKGRLCVCIYNIYTCVFGVSVLINNGDVTRRFLSLRVGPICIPAVAYELMNHRHRRTVFFLIDGNCEIFFSLFSIVASHFLPRRFTSEFESICLARAHTQIHSFVHSSYFIPFAHQNHDNSSV